MARTPTLAVNDAHAGKAARRAILKECRQRDPGLGGCQAVQIDFRRDAVLAAAQPQEQAPRHLRSMKRRFVTSLDGRSAQAFFEHPVAIFARKSRLRHRTPGISPDALGIQTPRALDRASKQLSVVLGGHIETNSRCREFKYSAGACLMMPGIPGEKTPRL